MLVTCAYCGCAPLPQRMDISILWNVLEPNLHFMEHSRARLSKQMYYAYKSFSATCNHDD